MASIRDAVAQIQENVDAVSGMRAAPTDPPESIRYFPFAVSYLEGGTWEVGPAGIKTGLHTIVCEVHVARKNDLAREVKKAMDYSDNIPNDLLDDITLGGTVETIVEMRYDFGPMGWGGVDTVGFRFYITVKMQSAIT